MESIELRQAALAALCICDPDEKCVAVERLAAVERRVDTTVVLSSRGPIPGRPSLPELVDPRSVPRRALGSREGRAALIHALAHIEFNAINLALDIVWRFSDQPESFYRDWTRVAVEEASHFQLLRAHLRQLGSDYGDHTAHNGLWEAAEKTSADLLARLALVARTLEARGLDVSPGLRDRLSAVGDTDGARILSVILRDEIGHVAIGSKWYHAICQAEARDPVATQLALQLRYGAVKARGPFNHAARREAGFTEAELAALTGPSE